MNNQQNGTAVNTDMAMPRQGKFAFGRTFYIANIMEIFERLAWYGFFAVSSIYMTTPKSQGGIGFSDIERGAVQGIIPFFLYLLPVFTGAVGDRVGYKKMFLWAFIIMAPGYYLLGQAQSFWSFFAALSAVAFGAACFKPVVVGTVSHSTHDGNRALGFGIFYTMVNIGGFIGPLVAGYMRAISWDAVFLMSAGWILLNFITLLFYQDHTQKSQLSLRDTFKSAQSVLGNGRLALTLFCSLALLMSAGVEFISYTSALSLIALWLLTNWLWDNYLRASALTASSWWRQPTQVSNPTFALYLLILAGFWTVYNQLFYTLPLYIRDYADTQDLLSWFGPAATEFLAHVNVAALADEIIALFARIQAEEVINLEALRLQWVHLKVNVPITELELLVSSLTNIHQLGESLSLAQATEMAHELVQYRQINPEYLINLNFIMIVLAQILVSILCQRFKPFYVLVSGLVVIVAAFLLLLMGASWISGQLVVSVIMLIALGEMLASPKSQEFVASIAPKSQTALYMGYYFVSMALGFLFAGFLSGWSYKVLVQEMAQPKLMWGLFAVIAACTAIALLWLNGVIIRQRATSVGRD
ncbi:MULTISPECIES: MFS transporter [unclassified Pseudoalteromonas]|uniref:MFS transporter n=1 Tax=unclassified Pseudoalteromonas TaxID=194690 RepID=UPI0030141E51